MAEVIKEVEPAEKKYLVELTATELAVIEELANYFCIEGWTLNYADKETETYMVSPEGRSTMYSLYHALKSYTLPKKFLVKKPVRKT